MRKREPILAGLRTPPWTSNLLVSCVVELNEVASERIIGLVLRRTISPYGVSTDEYWQERLSWNQW